MELYKIKDILKTKFDSIKIDLFDELLVVEYRDINFEIIDSTNIEAYNINTGIDYKKEIYSILKSLDDTIPLLEIPSYIIERLISDIYDSAGFTDNIMNEIDIPHYDYSNLLKLIKNNEREIEIISFGEKFKTPKSMERTLCQKTFDARHINSSKPKGKSLRDLRGTDEIIQKCIESGSGFEFVMTCIIKAINEKNYKIIGIYCTAGHHRSVAVVELMKKNLYPNAKIKHLHINR